MILFVSTVYDRSSLIGILEQGQDPKRTTQTRSGLRGPDTTKTGPDRY